MLIYVLFVLGFFILLKGADLLVEGSSALAHRMNIPHLIIGLTVVAFGTSAPELFISVYANLDGNPEIAISNILGSNIANVFLILGTAAIFYPLPFQRNTTFKEIPISLMAAIVLTLMAVDHLFNPGMDSMISRRDGLILLCFFMLFMYYIIGMARSTRQVSTEQILQMSVAKSVVFLLLGLGGLILGGHWIVTGAVAIAEKFNVSQSLIGLTIVAIGTSLPELATTITATRKGKADIAIGNVIGSNIFNIFLILGLSAAIKPLPVQSASIPDMMMTILSNVLLILFVYIGKKHVLQRWGGVMLVSIYAAYLIYKIFRG